jgi:hypothetical protein
MKQIYIETDDSFKIKQFEKLPIIEPDFISVTQLRGDINILEYAFKNVLITNNNENG